MLKQCRENVLEGPLADDFILSSYTKPPRHAAGRDSEGGNLQF